MRRTLVFSIFPGLLLASALALAASSGGLTDLTDGTRATLRDAAADKADKLIVRYGDGPDTLVDPRCPASSFLAISTDRQVMPPIDLDCANWQVSGAGYRYVARPGGAGALQRIVYKPGRVTIRLSGEPYAGMALSGPVTYLQTRLIVDDGTGATDHCGRWQEPVSDIKRNDEARVTIVGPTSPCDAELLFQDSFEDADPFPTDGSGWSNLVLQTPTGQPKAAFETRTKRARTGAQSAWFFAPKGGRGQGEACGKASLIKRETVKRGETVRFSASYWLEDSPTVVAPQLMDVECSPEQCGYQGSPGVRVVTTHDGRLRLDWKFLNWYRNQGLPMPADAPPPSPRSLNELPVGKWFRLTLRMVLGEGDQGLTEVYVDDQLEISVRGTNIAPAGMENLTRYSGVEIGITCNPSAAPQSTSLYVDDVLIEREIE